MSHYIRVRQTIVMKSELIKKSSENNMSVDEYMISLFHDTGGGSIFIIDDTDGKNKYNFITKIKNWFEKLRL
jgi:hypothetical protein